MVKIAFIAPDESQVELVRRTYEEHSREYAKTSDDQHAYTFSVHVAATYREVPDEALDADIMIVRGLLSKEMRRVHPSTAVVDVHIGSELVTSIYQAVRQYGNLPMAVTGSFNMVYGAYGIDQVLDVDIKTYLQENNEPPVIRELLREIRRDGRRILICGSNTYREASADGWFHPVQVRMSRESIWMAISDAKQGAVIRRHERERAEQFRTVLNHSNQGVIATDFAGVVKVCNAAAAELLQISDAVGKSMEEIAPRGHLGALFRSGVDFAEKVVPYRGEMLSVGKVSVVLQGDFSGHIVTLQKSSAIQRTEGLIRQQLYAKGHVARYRLEDVIGDSPALKTAIKAARNFASVTSNIMIVGDTGTGKEMFAQGIHNLSDRRHAPFVAINCAALSKSLLESELFGYAEGAFTGAAKGGKPGIFEIAHTGTIFLDEVSEIPLELQGRLLRVLQERQIMRLGDDKIIPIDVRIISATNKPLLPEVRDNHFRRDLFYRLNVLTLNLPDLNARGTDILYLAAYFLEEYCSRFQKPQLALSDAVCKILLRHRWDGNIRELRNVCETLAVLNDSGVLEEADVEQVLSRTGEVATAPAEVNYAEELRRFDRERILGVLALFPGDKAGAAKKLGISKTTLWRRMKNLGIDG